VPLPTPRTGAAVAFLLAAAAPAARCQNGPAAGRRWLGAQFPPAPHGAAIAIGATIGTADTATYALADARASGRHYVWLGRRPPPPAAAGTARYAVADVLPLDGRGAAGEVRYATCGTRAPGRPGAGSAQDVDDVRLDPALLAVGPFGPGTVYTSVARAWRADTRAGRIVPVPADRVVCLLDGDPEG
jgi:hypothetical protein